MTARPAAARERKNVNQRRWRHRQPAGVKMYAVPIDNQMLNAMIDAGLLGEDESADRGEVAKAVREALVDYFRARGISL
jgi:hypothetical protein